MLNLLFVRNRYFGDGFAYNLVPFETIKRYVLHRDAFNLDTWIKNLFGNVVLFVPIGIFFPLLNVKFISFWRLTAACLAVMLTVETLQMLLRVGSFDIDDLILNTAGAWIGWLLARWKLAQSNKLN